LRDFLISELYRLQKLIIKLELNYEARIKVLMNHKEEKKIEKLKKDFSLKRESIIEERKLYKERIDKIDKDARIEEHTSRMRDWETIQKQITNIPAFKKLLKIFGELDEKKKQGFGVPYADFIDSAEDNGYTKEQVDKMVAFFHKDFSLRKALIYDRYNNSLRSDFTSEIRKFLE